MNEKFYLRLIKLLHMEKHPGSHERGKGSSQLDQPNQPGWLMQGQMLEPILCMCKSRAYNHSFVLFSTQLKYMEKTVRE